MPEIPMPRLSDSMEEGTIVRWLRSDGGAIRRGEALVEIETDKATVTHEADSEGVLEILVAEGATVAVGAVIARIRAPGETVAAEPPQPRQPAAGQPLTQPPAATRTAAPPALAGPAAAVRASPIARRLALASGLELSLIAGSGPRGRILKADVRDALAARPISAAAPAPADRRPGHGEGVDIAAAALTADQPPAKGRTERRKLTRAQEVVARRMAEAKATIPDFSLEVSVDMTAAKQFRELLGAAVLAGSPTPSFNDLVIKAVALALRACPRANGSYRDGSWELHERINVGFAVAAQDALIVPTVFDADQKTLAQIANETRAVAQRVRDGAVTPPELAGGTFTVSNLGMYRIERFTAVINPPQAAILAVGAIVETPVVRDGELSAGLSMALSLTCDHRILYGADAAEFLAQTKRRLETPASLAL